MYDLCIDLVAGNENGYDEAIRSRDLHVYFVLVRIDWQRAAGVLILRITERELRKRTHVQ